MPPKGEINPIRRIVDGAVKYNKEYPETKRFLGLGFISIMLMQSEHWEIGAVGVYLGAETVFHHVVGVSIPKFFLGRREKLQENQIE